VGGTAGVGETEEEEEEEDDDCIVEEEDMGPSDEAFVNAGTKEDTSHSSLETKIGDLKHVANQIASELTVLMKRLRPSVLSRNTHADNSSDVSEVRATIATRKPALSTKFFLIVCMDKNESRSFIVQP